MIAKRIRGARHLRARNRGFIKLMAYLEQHHKIESAWVSPALRVAPFAGYRMQMIANLNRRVGNPQYHLTLAWGLHEQPTHEEMEASTDAVLRALGFDPEAHQWVAVAHKDAMHQHVHLVVNRVHPETLRVHQTPYDYFVMSKAVRELEQRFGWSHAAGVGEKRRAMNPDVRAIEPSQIKEKVKRGFGWSGRPAFQEWISVAAGERVYRYLQSVDPTWEGVHEILARNSLRYVRVERGGAIFDPTEPDFRARAGHLGRFATLPQLEKRLGPYVASEVSMHVAGSYRAQVLKRDPEIQASPLYQRFLAETGDEREVERRARADAWREQRESEKARRKAIRQKRLDRNRAMMASKTGERRRPQRLAAKLGALIDKDQLAVVIARERDALRAALGAVKRTPTFRSWLTAEAKLGNVDAANLLSEARHQRHVYKHFFERVPELSRFLRAVPARSHTVELPDGRRVERSSEALLTRRGQRIRPNDVGFLTLSGIADEALVSALGAVYVAREKDNSLSAIFKTDAPVDARAVAEMFRAAGAGNIRVGSVPYPGFEHPVRVAPSIRIDFLGRARSFITNRQIRFGPVPPLVRITEEGLDAPTTEHSIKRITRPPIELQRAATRMPIETQALMPRARSRWILENERVTGIAVAAGSAETGLRAIRTADETIVFRSNGRSTPGQRVIVVGHRDGYAAVRPVPDMSISQQLGGL